MPLQMLTTRATPKATKQAARYTPAGGAERCGMCRHYVPSSSCARIEGPISAAGWCHLYSQQVTWRPRAGQDAGLNTGGGPPGATLDLSFMTPGSLDGRITFTRASTGTYFDATGTLQTATANTPRWDYDPVTHVLRGLLIEEARTNIALQSADASNAVWQRAGNIVAAPTVTANQVTAPDGTLTAARVVYPAVSGAGASSAIAQPITMTVAVYTFSVWLRGNVGGEQVYLYTTADTTVFYRAAVTLTTAWQRFTVTTGTLTAASWFFEVGTDLRDMALPQTSKPAQTIYVWGGQVELGAFPTSYIPTTAASVTRVAEACSMPTNVAWFNTSTSSLAGEFIVGQSPNPSPFNSRDVCCISDGNTTNRLILRAQTTSSAAASIGTAIAATTTFSATVGNTPANIVSKQAGAWNGTAGVGSLNGGAAVSYAVGMPGTLNILFVGNDNGGSGLWINGWMRRVRYWPRALSSAELQSVTT